jgi:hypothetical protein
MKIYYSFADRTHNNQFAYKYPFDALMTSPAPKWNLRRLLHIIELVDNVQTLRASIDVTELLFDFARWCALQVIDLWDAPVIVRQYLETGDETLQVKGYMVIDANISRKNEAAHAASTAALNSIVTRSPYSAAGSAASAALFADPAVEDVLRTKFKQMVNAASY